MVGSLKTTGVLSSYFASPTPPSPGFSKIRWSGQHRQPRSQRIAEACGFDRNVTAGTNNGRPALELIVLEINPLPDRMLASVGLGCSLRQIL